MNGPSNKTLWHILYGLLALMSLAWLLAILGCTSTAPLPVLTEEEHQVYVHCLAFDAVLDCAEVRGRVVYRWDLEGPVGREGFDDNE